MYHAKPRMMFGIRTSDIEIRDLLKGWGAITIAFTILLSESYNPTNLINSFIISAFSVGTAFVLHELAHKLVAQRYRCFAEFRSNDQMLIMAIIFSFIGFIFAAPGAVMIVGRVNLRQNGHISLAGPLTNMILGLILLPVVLLGLPMISSIASFVAMINIWIGLFNLLPFLNFDGKKILRWSKPAYFGVLSLGLVLLLLQQIL